jgi:hypothetical protein
MEFLEEFAQVGRKIIQFADCLSEIFADDDPPSVFTGKGIKHARLNAIAAEFIKVWIGCRDI